MDRGGASPGGSDYRVNRRIRVPEVRVIGADGAQLGIMPTDQALRTAEELGLDLVEVSPKAVPPVCRIMDYGKFKYEQSKQQAKARKHQSTVIVKEVKFRPKTDDHDFDFKVKHIRRFLQEGNKAKLVIVFRGREIVHPETGQAMLRAVFEAVSDIGMIEQNPLMEGRRMLMVIAPRAGALKPGLPPPTMGISRPTTGPTTAAAPTPTPTAPTAPAPTPPPAAPTGPTVTTRPASTGPTVTTRPPSRTGASPTSATGRPSSSAGPTRTSSPPTKPVK